MVAPAVDLQHDSLGEVGEVDPVAEAQTGHDMLEPRRR